MSTVKLFGFEIPMAKPKKFVTFEESREKAIARRNKILVAFKQDILDAYTSRRKACYQHLIKHIDTAEAVPFVDGAIEYTYPDGHVGNFNKSSYDAMENAYNAVYQDQWDELLENSLWLNQLLKGLLNQPNRPEFKIVDGMEIPFSNLVSLLVEAHGFSML